jgi:amino acid permease
MTTFEMTQTRVCVKIGAGVLAFPGLISICGYLLGPCLIAVAGGVNYLACLTFLRIADDVHDASQYKDVARHFGGYIGEVVSDTFCALFLAALIGVYMVLMSTNLLFILRDHVEVSHQAMVIFIGATTTLLSLIQDSSLLAKFGFVGVVASVMYVLCVAFAGIDAAQQLSALEEPQLVYHSVPPGAAASVVKSFCVMLAGYAISDKLISLRARMQKPAEMRDALWYSHSVTVGIYLLVGLLGYYGWGSNVTENVVFSMSRLSRL